MKKTFALLMAALMTASMTTVAFAAPKNPDITLGGIAYWENNDEKGIQSSDGDHYMDLDKLTEDSLAKFDAVLEGGETLYIPVVYNSNPSVWVTDIDEVDGWDLALVEEDGNGKVSRPKFKVVEIDGTRGVVVAIEVGENDTLKMKEFDGFIGLGDTAYAAKKGEMAKRNITIEYGPKVIPFAEYDAESAIVDFTKAEDEVDVDFEHYAVFTVDVTTQKVLDLRYDTKYNADFNEMYEYANIEFLNFTGNPIFNRNGEMVIFADEDQYLYEVTKDGAKEVDGAEYDEDLGAFVFKTRTLKSYALSDEELDVDDVIADGEIVVEKPEAGDNTGKPNPDTGR